MRKHCIAIMAIVMVLSWGISNIAADKGLRIFIPLLNYTALTPVQVDLVSKTAVRLRFAAEGWTVGDFNGDGYTDTVEISQVFSILVQRLDSNELVLRGNSKGRLRLQFGADGQSTIRDAKFNGLVRGSGNVSGKLDDGIVNLDMILKCSGKHIRLNLDLDAEFKLPDFEFVSLEDTEGLSWIEIHNPTDTTVDMEG
jgi:hypothetical protein